MHLIILNKYLVERIKKMERTLPKVSQEQDKRQEIPFQHKRKKLWMVKHWNRFSTKVVESPFFLRYQNLIRCSPGQTVPGGPTQAGMLC